MNLKPLQQYLFDNSWYDGEIDNIFGEYSKTALYLYICSRFRRLGWELPSDRQLIFLRKDQKFTNQFPDFVIVWNKGVEAVYPATTLAGDYYIFQKRIWYKGIQGTAVIKQQYVKDAFRFITKKNWTKWPYFRQIKDFEYLRDNTPDRKIDADYNTKDDYHTHIHQMGKGIINWNYSAGCIGPALKYMKKITPLFKEGELYDLILIEMGG